MSARDSLTAFSTPREFQKIPQRMLVFFFLGLFILLSWLHVAAPIHFTTADLGRHLKNGELFVENRQILDSNHYSYTHPDHPAVCHHWGAGVIFYLIWKAFGFEGLSIFYAGMLLLSFGIFIGSAARNTSWLAAMGAGLWVLPLIGYRVEIRPEGFSSLFFALSFFLLNEHRAGRLKSRWLSILPGIQWMWVNTHVFYGLGLCLMGFYLIDAWINPCEKEKMRMLAGTFAASVLFTLLTPFGIKGILEPAMMFRTFPYMLAENQSAWFMMKRFPENFIYSYFMGMGVILGLALVFRLLRAKDRRKHLLPCLVWVFFGALAFQAVRGIAVFGLFAIPWMAECLQRGIQAADVFKGRWGRKILGIALAAAVLAACFFPSFFLSPLGRHTFYLRENKAVFPLLEVLKHPAWWRGLLPGENSSADFFKENQLKGPVFNNYDLGGYFIYHFFPQERPFVDNRPEAYPPEFFKKVYGPMQESEEVWHEIDQQFHFQVIYFYRHDQTPWAQPFLIARVGDDWWAPVFVDDFTIIFARRGGVNQSVIDRFEIPGERFGSSPVG